MNSILDSIKKMLGIDPDCRDFDDELVIYINTAINGLSQIGIGQLSDFMVTGTDETWNDYMADNTNYQMVKTYIYMKVKMMFDPPTSSFVIEAYNKQLSEIEWRLQIQKEHIDG